MNAELVADAVFLTDSVKGNPGSWSVCNVVVEVVLCRPARHRHCSIRYETTSLGLLEQGTKLSSKSTRFSSMLRFWLRPTNPQTASTPRRAAASKTLSMKSCFFFGPPDHREHVVEVADVGEPDLYPAIAASTLRARSLLNGWRRSRHGYRIEHRFGWYVRFARMKRRRELNIIGSKLTREDDPLFDGKVDPDRASRGVSSWSAAVSTPIFINSGLKGLIDMNLLASSKDHRSDCVKSE